MPEHLPNIPFSDPELAETTIKGLESLCGGGILQVLEETLPQTSDPLRALVGLARYLERNLTARTETALMAACPGYARMLTTLFSQSRLLTDILCRNPEYGSWLWSDAPLDTARLREEMVAEMWAAVEPAGDFDRRCVAMRRFSRREILRIAAREVWMRSPFASVAEDLSCLADASLETAIQMAREHLTERFGLPVSPTHGDIPERRCPFVVLAMGKLGGCELNFSSDIDLLFIYGDNGNTGGGAAGRLTHEEYFKKFGELIIKAVSENTAEGFVFRVDMRLRPFGKSGPLCTAFDEALDYYMNSGRAWERQALIKTRPCAGDLALGQALLDKLRSFIFPRYFDDATLEDVRTIKSQTEARIAARGETEREVKLGRGGIRDIEFTVQILQLLNGGRWPDLRTKNTLEAIEALGNRQSLTPFEATALIRHYIFLRQVEHRLQIEGGQQIHTLPAGEKELDEFAHRLGYTSGEAFMRVYRDHTADTRRILERFLASKGSGNLWISELLDPIPAAAVGLEKLREAGFQQPDQARAELLVMANGPENNPYTREVAQQFAMVAPSLITAFAAVPSPDNALMRLGQILIKIAAPGALYGLLRYNPALSRYLATLIANSEYLCAILVRDISLLDLVGSPSAFAEPSSRESLRAELAGLEQAADPLAAPYRLRDGEMLKVALRELIEGISVWDVGDELTQLAEVILENALRHARETVEARYGGNPRSFAILALGKFGGREMGYGSDMDLVFVHESGGDYAVGSVSDGEYFPAIASHTLKSLKEPTRYGILYDIDARLRPDGSKGVLSITEQRLVQYYAEEAHPFERFALMKVRAVGGDPDFAAHVESLARDVAFSMHLDADALDKLEGLRAKTAATASELDLKRYPGGLSEVEYTTRYWQLRHVQEHPELKRGGVFRALAYLEENDLENKDDCRTLSEAYDLYRRILNRIRMMLGGSQSKLPETEEARTQLALRLGMPPTLLEPINAMRRRVHDIYTRVLAEEQERARG